MMNRILRRILELGPLLCDLGLSAVGCFVFMRGFRLVAIDEPGSDTGLSRSDAGSDAGCDAGSPLKQFAGFDAVLLLLVLVAKEAPGMIRASGA
jgi:hypothetical protein